MDEKEKPVERANEWESDNRDPVFYYSREHRLSRASSTVQAMNEEKPIRKGFAGSFFGTKANVMLFVTIVLIFGVYMFSTRYSGTGNGVQLGGNTLALALVREDGVLILGIVKTMPKSGEAYVGVVDIAVSPVMPKVKEGEEQNVFPVFTHRILFNPVASESYSLSLPFEGNDFLVLFKNDTEQKSFRLRTKP